MVIISILISYSVGGGTAGCVLAGRISELSNVKVLLLEAGGEQTSKLRVPWFHLWLTNSPHSWNYITSSQKRAMKGLEYQKAPFWRGKVIGGTGAINTMIHMRGNPHDFDEWESLGNTGWSYKDCLPYLHKLEKLMKPEYAKHSTILKEAFLSAGELLGYSVVDEQTDGKASFAPYQFNIKNGRRWSTAQAYLLPVIQKRPNLHVALHAHVYKVLFESLEHPNRATGILVKYRRNLLVIRAKREIILSSGAVGSPHILLLSGIGPAQQLKEMDIPVIQNVPGVGENLQDHIAAYGLTWTTRAKGTAYNPFLYTANPMTYIRWKLWSSGPLAAPIGVEGNGFVPTKFGNESWPDIQITFVSAHPGFDGGTVYKDFLGISEELYYSYFSDNAFREGYTLYPILSRPYSRGRIKLVSSSPIVQPKIEANYLSDYRDVLILIEGLKIARKIGDTPPFTKDLTGKYFSKILPPCKDHVYESDEYWECWIRHLATTDHHPVGTCKMGHTEKDADGEEDIMAVVSYKTMKVKNVDNLRVVDASIMPNVPSGNINTPVIMVAEKAADIIKKDLTDLITESSKIEEGES